MTDSVEPIARPTTSTRDHGDLRRRLEAWLATKVKSPAISELVVPQSSGMSSETVLFDARWDEDGETHTFAVVSVEPAT